MRTDTAPAAPVERRVDVVIPVYGNPDGVKRCLESVLAFKDPSIDEVIVVDDGTRDPETIACLDAQRNAGTVRLIRHQANLGFVAAANAGITSSRRDVILLNSDTEVHGDWTRRLIRCADRDPSIGTVTPFSNNATVSSYPFTLWRHELPGGLRLSEVDGLFATVNAGELAEAPTGVGFCILIRRTCLDQVGLFDPSFGRGYGEETDFCQRARLAGWRNVVCADTYIYHSAGGSFGPDRRRRAYAAERVLRDRYPDYAHRVRDCILSTRMAAFRRRVDAARAALSKRQAAAVAWERLIERACLLAFAVNRALESR